MHALNARLAAAFPTSVRENVLAALETFPEPEHPVANGFSVKVAGEMVTIPYRLYHSPGHIKTEHLTDIEKVIGAAITASIPRTSTPASRFLEFFKSLVG
jgi:hypothetical protein